MRSMVLFPALGAAAFAQGSRSFVVTGMEGAGSVNNWDEQTTPGQFEL